MQSDCRIEAFKKEFQVEAAVIFLTGTRVCFSFLAMDKHLRGYRSQKAEVIKTLVIS